MTGSPVQLLIGLISPHGRIQTIGICEFLCSILAIVAFYRVKNDHSAGQIKPERRPLPGLAQGMIFIAHHKLKLCHEFLLAFLTIILIFRSCKIDEEIIEKRPHHFFSVRVGHIIWHFAASWNSIFSIFPSYFPP